MRSQKTRATRYQYPHETSGLLQPLARLATRGHLQYLNRVAFRLAFELYPQQCETALARCHLDAALARLADNRPGRTITARLITYSRAPYIKLAPAGRPKRSGIWMGPRTHQIKTPPRRPRPVDPAVFRPPPSKITAFCEILRTPWRRSRNDQRMTCADDRRRHRHNLAVKR